MDHETLNQVINGKKGNSKNDKILLHFCSLIANDKSCLVHTIAYISNPPLQFYMTFETNILYTCLILNTTMRIT